MATFPRRILVTGANGFIGRHAVAALVAAGFEVVALGRSLRAPQAGVETVAADLLGPAPLAPLLRRCGCNLLLHLAWEADPQQRWAGASNVAWVEASLRLARAFAAAGGKRMVTGGSCAEYDWSAGGPLAETAAARPATLYGTAKLALGAILAAAAPTLGIGFAHARIFFAYGPGEPPGRLVSDLIARFAAGQPVDCTDGRQRRDYLHAADIGTALALIAAADVAGPVNVASGTAIAVADLVRGVAAAMGRPDLPRLGAVARPADDPPEIRGSIPRLAALGFTPRLDLATGIAETVAVARSAQSRRSA